MLCSGKGVIAPVAARVAILVPVFVIGRDWGEDGPFDATGFAMKIGLELVAPLVVDRTS